MPDRSWWPGAGRGTARLEFMTLALAMLLSGFVLLNNTSAHASDSHLTNRDVTYGSGEIAGTVTAATGGAPIPGVQVVAYDPTTGNQFIAVTASNGQYTITRLGTADYTVSFIPPDTDDSAGYVYQYYGGSLSATASTPVSVTDHLATAGVNAALATGASITGTVTGPSGATLLTGLEVDLVSASGSGVAPFIGDGDCYRQAHGKDYEYCDDYSAEVNPATGTYTLAGIPAGNYYVQFDGASGYTYVEDQEVFYNYAQQWYNGATSLAGAAPITVSTGQSLTGINATMAAGGAISGNVTAGGKPASSVDVEVFDSAGVEVGQGTTLSDGDYSVGGLQSGSYKVEFNAYSDPGFAPDFYNGAVSVGTGQSVSVTAGSTTSGINGALPLPGSVSGSVVLNGEPVPNVTVDLLDTDDGFVTPTETGADGSNSFNDVTPGSHKADLVSGPHPAFQYYNAQTSFANANPVTVTAGSNTALGTTTLSIGGEITGTVTDKTSGAGLVNAEVELLDAQGDELDSTYTNPDGTYTLDGIPSGTYYVEFDDGALPGVNYQVQYYGGKQTLAGSTSVTVTAGATTTGIDAALAPADTPETPNTVTLLETTPTAPLLVPGIPSISQTRLSGLSSGKLSLRFTLTDGQNEAPLQSFRLSVPSGIKLTKAAIKDLSLGGLKFTAKLKSGALTVVLRTPAKSFTVKVPSAAFKVSKSLKSAAKKHHLKSLAFKVLLTPVTGASASLELTIKKPS